jgi:hypothetical protein
VYRPIGLASSGVSTINAGRASTYADRRRAAAERLRLAENLSTRLEAVVRPDPAAGDGASLDPDGVLRACVRALVPTVTRHAGLDVMVSIGPDHAWAARVRQGEDGVAVDLVHGPGAPLPSTGVSQTQVVADLATWLWTGEVTPR